MNVSQGGKPLSHMSLRQIISHVDNEMKVLIVIINRNVLSLYALPLFYSFSFLLLARLMIFLLW